MKTVLRWDKKFWREGEASIVHQILCRVQKDSRSEVCPMIDVQHRDVDNIESTSLQPRDDPG
jgi:hypothetical protein